MTMHHWFPKAISEPPPAPPAPPAAIHLTAATPAEGSVPRNGAVAARETVCPHIRGTVTQYCSLNFTLTDEERAAVETAMDGYIAWMDDNVALETPRVQAKLATLRKLLARLHT
jgi:hypothetical protein